MKSCSAKRFWPGGPTGTITSPNIAPNRHLMPQSPRHPISSSFWPTDNTLIPGTGLPEPRWPSGKMFFAIFQAFDAIFGPRPGLFTASPYPLIGVSGPCNAKVEPSSGGLVNVIVFRESQSVNVSVPLSRTQSRMILSRNITCMRLLSMALLILFAAVAAGEQETSTP